MSFWNKIIILHKELISISFLYLLLHLANLNLLPIFNDESIYIDWAWSHTHMAGHLYDSLLDAKPPLMIWIFGFFASIFPDSLYAGRFTSVLFGLLTLLGIFKLGIKIVNKEAALIASLLFAITPLFVFYNRQALLEAGIAFVGVWSCIALINVLHKPNVKNSILLGSILGIGFFIKSSALLFVVAATLIILGYTIKEKKINRVTAYAVAALTFFCVDFLLFINPLFWQTFHTNNRYAYTLGELLTFPIEAWIKNLFGFFEIGFVFLTPLTFLAGLVGLYLLSKKKLKYSLAFSIFFLSALLLQIISGKSQSLRYIVSLLPFLVIPAGYVLYLLWVGTYWKKVIVLFSAIIPFVITILLIFYPEEYISQTAKVSHFADTTHIQGQTSGHGIYEAMEFLKTDSKNEVALVLFGFTIGNPESAINVYSQRTHNLAPLHIDSKMFTGIDSFKCLTSKYPAYFVTRHDQLLGMERFFTLEKTFPNPDQNYSIRIYTLKKSCQGTTASLSDIYEPSIQKIFQMKNGIY